MQEVNSEKVLSFASEAGRILLENGAEISRVEETMERISSNYGESGEKFFVLSNGIFTTGRSYANAEFIPIKGARLDKVVAVNQLSRDIARLKLPFGAACERLEQIKRMPPSPMWMQLLAAAFGCGGFCAIFGGSLLDCAASLLAAVVLDLFVIKVGTPYLSKTLGNICAGFIGTLLCILLFSAGVGRSLGNMIVGTLILLIPGVAFTNGLRDVANEDYLAGMTRLVDALMMFLCIATGVCFAFVFHGWLSGGVVSMGGMLTDPLTGRLPVQMLSSLVGTASCRAVRSSVEVLPRMRHCGNARLGRISACDASEPCRCLRGDPACGDSGGFHVALRGEKADVPEHGIPDLRDLPPDPRRRGFLERVLHSLFPAFRSPAYGHERRQDHNRDSPGNHYCRECVPWGKEK